MGKAVIADKSTAKSNLYNILKMIKIGADGNGYMDVQVIKAQQSDNSPAIDLNTFSNLGTPGYHSTIAYTNTTSSWSGNEPWASYAADYYFCKYTQWVFMLNAVSLTASCTHDDAAAVFLNDVKLGGGANGTTAFNVTFNLQAGWNKIEWVWYEHGGGAYCTTSINFATRSDCLYAGPTKLEGLELP